MLIDKLRRRPPFSLVLAVLAFAAGSGLFSHPVRADGVEDVRRLVDEGKYRDALKQISQQLGAKGGKDATSSPDRYELLCLKGESLLRLGDRAMATSAFEQAARAASEPRAVATPRAMALLVKKSGGNRYKPKNGPAAGIDIVAPESRREAFAALYEEMSATLRPTLERALRGKTLPPMMDALPSLFDLASVEYASKGSADESRKILAEFGAHARGLMESELNRVRLRIESLDEVANTVAFAGDQLGRRGLHTNERNELRDLATYTKQIADTARKVRADVRQLGLEPNERWNAILAQAVEDAELARAVLEQAQ